MSEDIKVTREMIVETGTMMVEALRDFGIAKTTQNVVQARWDGFFYRGLRTGHIAGRNEAERVASAMEHEDGADLWVETLQAEEEMIQADIRLKAARAMAKQVGRQLLLQSMEMGRSYTVDFEPPD